MNLWIQMFLLLDVWHKAGHQINIADGKVYVASMGPTWVLSAPDGPHEPCYQVYFLGLEALLIATIIMIILLKQIHKQMYKLYDVWMSVPIGKFIMIVSK